MAEMYEATLIGNMPILMHNNNLDGQAEVAEWIKTEGASLSVAGDDRSPVWTWFTSLYFNPETDHLAIPFHCLMAAMRVGGAKVPAKKPVGVNWSKPSQFGLGIQAEWLDILVNGKPIPVEPLRKIVVRDRNLHPQQFEKHKGDVEKHGIKLHVVPVVNPATKRRNIRVRPKIDQWFIRVPILVNYAAITQKVLKDILEASGLYGGLLDWSPHSYKCGPYGTFQAEIKAAPAARKSA